MNLRNRLFIGCGLFHKPFRCSDPLSDSRLDNQPKTTVAGCAGEVGQRLYPLGPWDHPSSPRRGIFPPVPGARRTLVQRVWVVVK